MKGLFDAMTVKDVTFRNRIVMPPMCMYSSDENGFVQPFHLTHYETRAIGGAGLIILEATAVEPRGRISSRDLGIWSDAHIEGLKAVVNRIHAHGAKAGIQIAHAGRKSTVLTDDVVAPSAICFDEKDPEYKTPRALSSEELPEIAARFGEASRRANEAGFDVVEIHGAHGYLINEFLSPLTNKRTDAFSHSEKRGTAFLRLVLEAVHAKWPANKPLFLRVSAEDYDESGNHDTDIAEALNLVKDLGIDVINVSSGGVISIGVKAYDGYQTTFAETIKQKTGLAVLTGGKIRIPQMADELFKNGRADFVFIGRQLLIQPYWPIEAAKTLGIEIDYTPKQYLRWYSR